MELATGKKTYEEWRFLPRNWRNPIHRKQIFFVQKWGHELSCGRNIVLFGFLPWYKYPKGTGDILILNMASRKKFWMQKAKLENEIMSKDTSVTNGLEIMSTKVRWMRIEGWNCGSRGQRIEWGRKPASGIEIKIDIQTWNSPQMYIG